MSLCTKSETAILPTLPDEEEEEWCAATAAEEDGGGSEVALADATDPPPVMVILRLLTQSPEARHSKDRDHVSLICLKIENMKWASGVTDKGE